jgi:SAM-dependent methyltransferase
VQKQPELAVTLRLYHDLAHLWPIISPPEEYRVEAAEWRDLIWEEFGWTGNQPAWDPRAKLLDLGCGGGHLLSHFTSYFTTEAVDVSPEMLEISRGLNPTTVHHLGDMRTIRLGRTFEVVTIHDAVNYMVNEEDLRAAIETAQAHLEPGGLVLLAPDCLRDTFAGSRVVDWTRETEDQYVTFIEYVAQPSPEATTLESVFVFIINRDGEIQVEVDRHTSGLFPKSLWLDSLSDAGLEAKYVQTDGYAGGFGGNLFVGRMPG